MIQHPQRPSLSIVSLILANVVPLFGVLFSGWDLFTIFVLYWFETAVIGFYNILKLAKASGPGCLRAFLVPFFIFHFGMFMGAHILFIVTLFAPGGTTGRFSFDAGSFSVVLKTLRDVMPAVIGLLVSHGISFATNFLGKKEYERLTSEQIMMAPYYRVGVMHVTIIFGGMVTMFFGAPVLALVLLIAIKTIIDVKMHQKAHTKIQARPAVQAV